jgi:hypothetical protein
MKDGLVRLTEKGKKAALADEAGRLNKDKNHEC